MHRQRAEIDTFPSMTEKTCGMVSLLVIISEMQIIPKCDSPIQTTFKRSDHSHHHGCMGKGPTFLEGNTVAESETQK